MTHNSCILNKNYFNFKSPRESLCEVELGTLHQSKLSSIFKENILVVFDIFENNSSKCDLKWNNLIGAPRPYPICPKF